MFYTVSVVNIQPSLLDTNGDKLTAVNFNTYKMSKIWSFHLK